MNKVLLSVLAGVMMIGSASALPSQAERKAMCNANSGEFVWVEKTGTCIPSNPCLSDDADIKDAYCANNILTELPADEELRTKILDVYAEDLNTTVSGVRDISTSQESGYLGVETADGGYFVADYKTSKAPIDDVDLQLQAIIWGFKLHGISSLKTYPVENDGYIGGVVKDERQCASVAMKATVIYEKSVISYNKYDNKEKMCWFLIKDLYK